MAINDTITATIPVTVTNTGSIQIIDEPAFPILPIDSEDKPKRRTRKKAAKKDDGPNIAEVIGDTPEPLRSAMRSILRSSKMNEGAMMMLERGQELGDMRRAALIGIMMDPISRKAMDEAMDKAFNENKLPSNADFIGLDGNVRDEVVIGAGVTAAIYCATRAVEAVKNGEKFEKLLVLDSGSRVGGTFAVSYNPAFYLNSRSRPGEQGAPGQGGALNLIANAPLQPFDLTSDEFAPNTAIADAVRVALSMYATVVPNTLVQNITPDDPTTSSPIWSIQGRRSDNRQDDESQVGATDVLVQARRVIIATGPGRPSNPFGISVKTDRVMDYYQFMMRADMPFPLRGMKRVAVIGGGDSGKTIVETLLGQGPRARMSVPSMDWVDKIDWYGPGASLAEETWYTTQRPRYRGIGRSLRADRDGQRVKPFDKAQSVIPTGVTVLVDGKPYDHVILATGFTAPTILVGSVEGFVPFNLNDYQVGLTAQNPYGLEADNSVIKLGPAAEIALTPAEQLGLSSVDPSTGRSRPVIPENSAAIWRYGPRTATVAAYFAGTQKVRQTDSEVNSESVLGSDIINAEFTIDPVTGLPVNTSDPVAVERVQRLQNYPAQGEYLEDRDVYAVGPDPDDSYYDPQRDPNTIDYTSVLNPASPDYRPELDQNSDEYDALAAMDNGITEY